MKAITLSDDVVRDLERLSARFGISPEEIIRRGINECLKEKESELLSQNEFGL